MEESQEHPEVQERLPDHEIFRIWKFCILFYEIIFSFLFFKSWKYDNTFTGDLQNTEQSEFIIPPYITIIFK